MKTRARTARLRTPSQQQLLLLHLLVAISVHMHVECHNGILLHCLQAEVVHTVPVRLEDQAARQTTVLKITAQHRQHRMHMLVTDQQQPAAAFYRWYYT
jgi:hypothetical protein